MATRSKTTGEPADAPMRDQTPAVRTPSPRGRILLYTFGSPVVSIRPLSRENGDFLPGLRVMNVDWENRTDIVSWLGLSGFKHPKLELLCLGEQSSTKKDFWWHGAHPSPELHRTHVYVQRAGLLGGTLGTVARIGLHHSYDHDVKDRLWALGWDLLGTARRARAEVSHLMQHPVTKVCMLTFEGTDRWQEWFYNVNVLRTTYCGFSGIHWGFKGILHNMITDSRWQNNVRPHLGQCREVHVVGHSLGGAMATLFATCAYSGREGNKDYDRLKWSWRSEGE